MRVPCGWIIVAWLLAGTGVASAAEDDLFETQVAPILRQRCLSCHDAQQRKGELSLQTRADLFELEYVLPGDPDGSYLLEVVSPAGGKAAMPKDADPLTGEQVAAIRAWIQAGAAWPEGLELHPAAVTDRDWWSLLPLTAPEVPPFVEHDGVVRGATTEGLPDRPPFNEIDAFIAAGHREHGLSFAPLASRRQLIRRLYFDLIGLPPTPEEVERFVADTSEKAYERLVDRLLESPRYGERWARHWLDVVHYGDTHGYDKDKPRPHAWPYRDYVIRSFNQDKPWSCFVQEQIAGDVLFPGTRDGIEALGFIAAGPWDFVGHAEVPESKIDGKIARHLDRDDMIRNTLQSFNSLTVGCAQCHNHKFDPILQEDYYRLQAVFAAVDRADRPYYRDHENASELLRRYASLTDEQRELEQLQKDLASQLKDKSKGQFEKIEAQIAALKAGPGNPTPAFGYHSGIAAEQETTKWVQLDFGQAIRIDRVVVRPAFDPAFGIGAGFGFPPRFRVEVSEDAEFKTASPIADHESTDLPNPGVKPLSYDVAQLEARYLRFTSSKLAKRNNDYILALAEIEVFDGQGKNRALEATVTALDSIEAAPRWGRANLVDGKTPTLGDPQDATLAELQSQLDTLRDEHFSPEQTEQWRRLQQRLPQVKAELQALPEPDYAYVGTVHHGSGTFIGRGHLDGQPREIHLLHRGDITQPGRLMTPAALPLFDELPHEFSLDADHAEGERRAALANWLASPKNHLTWRSVVNRVWQYHFGRGLVETPNDFGRNGALPTHPELLDWLAADFRDHGQSLKRLHRMIVTSYTYRQSSAVGDPESAEVARLLETDADNRFLWRMNRRKLEAEAVRDSVLQISGKLNLQMGGPAFQDFVIEKPQHSPHYEYHLHDPEDPRSHRRSVYRFIVRSQLQPFMNTLDCADPSLQVARRNESLTPLQALTLLNNGIIVTMSKHFAAKMEAEGGTRAEQVARGFYAAVGRPATDAELQQLLPYVEQHGMPNYARLLFNLNEFTFVD